MDNKERIFIIITLFAISLVTSIDLYTDFREGVTWWHVSFEGAVALIAAAGLFYLISGNFKLKHNLNHAQQFSSQLIEENEQWKKQSRKFLEGLGQSIDDQLTSWNLTKAEKEVAFLLLKGFGLKEIAQLRGTTEKTARVQSTSIYSKTGLANRSQLSAYFLEDLLIPPS
ncbi:MAG: response regulator transcription factor [Halobacteriovoraceae bacterium]|nr:response regulator transcription factor [Halobacteriovoraceae bacterium]